MIFEEKIAANGVSNRSCSCNIPASISLLLIASLLPCVDLEATSSEYLMVVWGRSSTNGLFCGVGVWAILRNVIELLLMLIKVKIHTFLHAGRVWSIANIFERNVDKNPEQIQFITAENGHVTTRIALEKLANQFAHWGLKFGLTQKNTVCLMVFNCPEYVAFWLGMAKIGVSTAMLNTNIIGNPFMHSVQVSVEKSEKKIVVVDGDLAETLGSEIETLRSEGVEVLFLQDLLQEISSFSEARPSISCRNQMKESDPVLFVFTSGTTGLPKAAKISNSRFYMMTLPCEEMAYLREGERMYCALPLYHSAGGILGAGGCLLTGATLVFRFDSSQTFFVYSSPSFPLPERNSHPVNSRTIVSSTNVPPCNTSESSVAIFSTPHPTPTMPTSLSDMRLAMASAQTFGFHSRRDLALGESLNSIPPQKPT
jgi:hypothetical protein